MHSTNHSLIELYTILFRKEKIMGRLIIDIHPNDTGYRINKKFVWMSWR